LKKIRKKQISFQSAANELATHPQSCKIAARWNAFFQSLRMTFSGGTNFRPRERFDDGEVAEWLKALVC
jgi:hypothetical protein